MTPLFKKFLECRDNSDIHSVAENIADNSSTPLIDSVNNQVKECIEISEQVIIEAKNVEHSSALIKAVSKTRDRFVLESKIYDIVVNQKMKDSEADQVLFMSDLALSTSRSHEVSAWEQYELAKKNISTTSHSLFINVSLIIFAVLIFVRIGKYFSDKNKEKPKTLG